MFNNNILLVKMNTININCPELENINLDDYYTGNFYIQDRMFIGDLFYNVIQIYNKNSSQYNGFVTKYSIIDKYNSISFKFKTDTDQKRTVTFRKTTHANNTNLGKCKLTQNEYLNLEYVLNKYPMLDHIRIYFYDENLYFVIIPNDKFIKKISIKITDFKTFKTKSAKISDNI